MKTKEGIEAVVERLRREHKDALAQQIADEPGRSYESLAREWNVTLGYVYRLARARGIRRVADKASEKTTPAQCTGHVLTSTEDTRMDNAFVVTLETDI